MNTLTPNFDRLVAKARKAGYDVIVTEVKRKRGSRATAQKRAVVGIHSFANVIVFGTVECLSKNTSFKL